MRSAKRCLKIISFFDLHTDLPSAIYNDNPSSVSFDEEISREIVVAAFFIPEKAKNPYSIYRNMYREFLWSNTIPQNSLKEDKALLFSLEGGVSFEKDLKRLYSMKKDGISSVSLTWNGDNSLAGGAFGFGGLTQKGISAVKLLNELNIALDISHLNEKSSMKAVEFANTVLASHSNCYEVFAHPRNLKREALSAVKEKGGIVGINFYLSFLPRGDVFEGIYKNIEYMLSLGLENSIAIGSDFDGADMNEKLKGTEDILSLYAFLEERLGDKALLDRIFFENAFNFYKKLFDKQGIM